MSGFSIPSYIKAVIAHDKLIYVVVAALCALGIVGLKFIDKDEFPTFELKEGLVAAVYPGATPEQVENELTKPLEDILLSIPEVDRSKIESVSSTGMSYLIVDLTCPQKRKTEVWNKIKHKLSQSKVLLPPGVLTIQVVDDFSDVSAMLLAFESEDKGWSEMMGYAERLKDELRKIDRLASVTVLGEQKEEIAVKVDPDRMRHYGISPAALTYSYLSANLNIPSGSFSTDYTSSPIVLGSSTSSEEDVANRVIYSDPSGISVKLRDIADIERRVCKPSSFVRYNGKNALIMNLVMRPDNNISAFGEDVDKVLEAFESTLPSSVKVHRVTDQPEVVDRSIVSFLRDLLISMLVVIFVMIMMFPIRSALIASSGVPVCTMIALMILFVSGMCLNTVTLGALIVVLGMIVDDSIITMDGYMGNLRLGMDKQTAAAKSAKDLFMPMFMATLSIASMFFPMLSIITGYLGDFIQSFPWVILIALMTSLVYAVTVVPSLEVKFIQEDDRKHPTLITKAQRAMFRGMQAVYDKMQAKAFNHPGITIGVGVVSVLLGVLMFSRLNIQMMPFASRNSFAVEINLDAGCGIEDTRAVADSLEKMLLQDSRVTSVTSFVGMGAPRYHATYSPKMPSSTFAQLIVNTVSCEATEEMLPYIEAKYESYFTNAQIRIKQMDYQGTSFPVCVEVSGPDRNEFFWVADSIRTYMSSLNHDLKYVHANHLSSMPEVEVEMDSDESSRLGVDRTMLGLSLLQGFSSSTLSNVYDDGKYLPVNLYSLCVNDTMRYDALNNFLVPSFIPSSNVPLRQVASISPVWELKSLYRKGCTESIPIEADLKYGHSHPQVMKKISSFVDDFIERHPLPEGVNIKYGGLSSVNDVIGTQIAWSFVGAILIMFFFLLLHFRKVSLTALSMLLSLLCLFGASLGLWLFNLDFSMTAVLGIVSLIGIIVRNGIIMFEYAEELHFKEGVSVKESAMLAGQRRMRPIFLTSCTTALGVLPMIISGDALWQPMGLVICFGIMASIFLIVFIMPVSYWKVFEKTYEE